MGDGTIMGYSVGSRPFTQAERDAKLAKELMPSDPQEILRVLPAFRKLLSTVNPGEYDALAHEIDKLELIALRGSR